MGVGIEVGVGLGVGSLIRYKSGNTALGEKIPGVDLVYKLCEYAAKEHKTVFLLGGREKDFFGRPKKPVQPELDVAAKASLELSERYPGIKIVGATSSFSGLADDDEKTLSYIHACMHKEGVNFIDFLFVAYNHPRQEKWILRNAKLIPSKVSMGIGGSFDYIANVTSRSPKVLIGMNLEWLYRLVTQPWRLHRIVRAFPVFPLKIYLESLK